MCYILKTVSVYFNPVHAVFYLFIFYLFVYFCVCVSKAQKKKNVSFTKWLKKSFPYHVVLLWEFVVPLIKCMQINQCYFELALNCGGQRHINCLINTLSIQLKCCIEEIKSLDGRFQEGGWFLLCA